MRWRSRAAEREQPFETFGLGRLTWLGLAIAALGWVVILGETTVAGLMFAKTARPAPPTFHADAFEIGKCVILSGFGLAIVGALQTGFGTLNRFFGAVLMRSGRSAPTPQAVEPQPVAQPMERPKPASYKPAPYKPAPSKPAPSVTIERRPYRKFADGSVEVDTILGTRLFKTMAEASEFI